jgi:Flp pilus assembly protein TadD
LELEPDLAEAHTSLGYVQFYHDWDWTAAERTYRRALALKPGYATAHQFYGNYLDQLGRVDEAEREWHQALALDPLSLIINAGLGWHHYFAGQFPQAVAALERALELDGTFVPAHTWLGLALGQLGRTVEAVAALSDAVRCSGESPSTVAELARARALAGEADAARGLLAGLDARAAERHVPPYEVAGVYLALGDHGRAFDWLERAFQDRSHSMVFLRSDPRFAGVRDQPRYRDLLRRVGLEGTAPDQALGVLA